VVKLWNDLHPGISIVQVGQLEHNHPLLNGVIDMRGKTNVRQLIRTIFKAEGVLSCVSFPMHIAAALEKPCVVVAGAREGTRWELYPSHRFLYMNGAMSCGLYDGCWKSKLEECAQPVETNVGKAPLCLDLIRPADVVRAMELYYMGGVLNDLEVAHV
jgi:ADP-heptose:LPS heptosyltransferase